MSDKHDQTIAFKPVTDESLEISRILERVYEALEYKGYQPENQITGYILSGDPTYITSHDDARKLIRQIDRDKLLEELLDFYLKGHGITNR